MWKILLHRPRRAAVSDSEERALRPEDSFKECPECPEMVVLSAGEFTMGSPPGEAGRSIHEGPQRKVTIARPFAVGKYEVAFAEWEACVAGGGCTGNPKPFDQRWGRGRRPVIYVSWHDAKEYAAWLSRKTGKTYRLLSEAEWEYAARRARPRGTPSGIRSSILPARSRCGGREQDGRGRLVPGEQVWSPRPARERVGVGQGYLDPSYEGAPTDGSVWSGGDVSLRVLRGGNGGQNLQLAAWRKNVKAVIDARSDPLERPQAVG